VEGERGKRKPLVSSPESGGSGPEFSRQCRKKKRGGKRFGPVIQPNVCGKRVGRVYSYRGGGKKKKSMSVLFKTWRGKREEGNLHLPCTNNEGRGRGVSSPVRSCRKEGIDPVLGITQEEGREGEAFAVRKLCR